MARELRNVEHRAEKLGLSDVEIAFYDAVAQGREELEADEQLLEIAKGLVVTIKHNLSIDWGDHENAKSKIRASVRRLLRRRSFKPEEYKNCKQHNGASNQPLSGLYTCCCLRIIVFK